MKLPENSLFAMLLRASWWVSALAGLGVFVVMRLLLDTGFGVFAALPFWVIACVVLWREWRVPRGARLARALEDLRAMSTETFMRAIEEGFRRRGYAVKRIEGGEADLELEKAGRVSLASANRWKAARTGVEPLRALAALGERRAAAETFFLCAGELTDQALAFAAERGIKLVTGPELVVLVRSDA